MTVRDVDPGTLARWLADHRDAKTATRLRAFGGIAGEALDGDPSAQPPAGTLATFNGCAADDSWGGRAALAVREAGVDVALAVWELEAGVAVIRLILTREGTAPADRRAAIRDVVLELAARHGTVGGWVAQDNAAAAAALAQIPGVTKTTRASLSPFDFYTYARP